MKRFLALFLTVGLVLSFIGTNTVSANAFFKDVPEHHLFYKEIKDLVDKNIISGFTDGTFHPDNGVTRAQAAIIIGKALNLNGEPRNTNFKDVNSNVTGSGYIASAVSKGIISGFTDNTYRPNDLITRGQMAIFINRAFEFESEAYEDSNFEDVSLRMAAYRSILNLAANGITSGYADGTFRPNEYVTRGEFCAFMFRVLEEDRADNIVNIPDEDFEDAIRDLLQKPEGYITVEDMRKLETIDVSYIHNLSGIEYAVNLTELSLEGSEIHDISPLSGLTKLTYLDLYANSKLQDITPLSGLTNLKYLDLALTEVNDISPLKGLTNLEKLILSDLYGDGLIDISPLSGLTKLTYLELGGNELEDIRAAADFTNLEFLSLSANQISDISALNGLTNLKTLHLESNKINDISALSSLVQLEELSLSINNINDISPLSELTNLEKLSLDENNINNISPLRKMTGLKSLDLSYNKISEISILNELTGLKYLYLSNNNFAPGFDRIIDSLKTKGVDVSY